MAGRVYAPKPEPGPIELSLAGLSVRDQHREKARALHAAIQNAAFPVSFALDGYRVQIDQAPSVFAWLDPDGAIHHGMEIVVSGARVVGGKVLPLDNPYRFVNPPIKVGNGTFRQEAGQDVPNTEERPLEALQRILLDAVLHVARARGAI